MSSKCRSYLEPLVIAIEISSVISVIALIIFTVLYVHNAFTLHHGYVHGFGALLYAFTALYITAILVVYFTNCTISMIVTHKTFHREYVYTWQLLHHTGLAPTITDEEYWRLIYQNSSMRNSRFTVNELNATLEKHIRFCVCYLESLSDLTKGVNNLKRWHLHLGSTRLGHSVLWQFFWLLLLIAIILFGSLLVVLQIAFPAGPMGFFPVAVILFLPVVLITQEGPTMLLVRARTIAICEFFLDEPGVDLATLPPPEDTDSRLRRWWIELYERTARIFYRDPA